MEGAGGGGRGPAAGPPCRGPADVAAILPCANPAAPRAPPAPAAPQPRDLASFVWGLSFSGVPAPEEPQRSVLLAQLQAALPQMQKKDLTAAAVGATRMRLGPDFTDPIVAAFEDKASAGWAGRGGAGRGGARGGAFKGRWAVELQKVACQGAQGPGSPARPALPVPRPSPVLQLADDPNLRSQELERLVGWAGGRLRWAAGRCPGAPVAVLAVGPPLP